MKSVFPNWAIPEPSVPPIPPTMKRAMSPREEERPLVSSTKVTALRMYWKTVVPHVVTAKSCPMWSWSKSMYVCACQVGPSCHDAGSSDASSLEPTSRISWHESASRVRESVGTPRLGTACLLLLQQHAAREPADQGGDEDCKRGGRHLREEDAASAQLDDRLDGDEAGEDHREACGAGRLFVPLPARHEEVDEEGRADRKQAVEGAHERDDPHRAGDGAQRRDDERLARDARKEKVKDGRRHHHVRRRRHILAQEVLDQLPVADPIAHAERAEAGQQPIDGGGALLVRRGHGAEDDARK
mmetsp:Transcript_18779/g.63346  ORF Transcript_18779/g.63346 Transcript_18779/m.63346 type:complete len:300 (-) Transcript_18779:156-1055(-)